MTSELFFVVGVLILIIMVMIQVPAILLIAYLSGLAVGGLLFIFKVL